jgi:hypothetical protein
MAETASQQGLPDTRPLSTPPLPEADVISIEAGQLQAQGQGQTETVLAGNSLIK